MLNSIDSGTATAWGVAVGSFTMAVFERIKNSKKVERSDADKQTLSLAHASEERARIHQQIADDYKTLLEKERLEHKATRDFWHDENGKNQALLGAANLKVMELQDRPDLRDILSILKTQSEGIKEILLLLARTHPHE